MPARLIASFSRADVEAIGAYRWGELCKSILPALNILADAPVYFHEEGDMIQVLAAPQVRPVPVCRSLASDELARCWAAAPGEVFFL